MIVLGIETSCDETAAALVERRPDGSGRILADIVLSQVADHAAFGGVVPEIAARAHVEALDGVVAAAMRAAGVGFADIDAVAATAGPGLIGGVIVGLTTAKAIALAAGKPLIAVNHLEGHALTAQLTDSLAFPYLLLLVSGGHTQFLSVEGVGDYRRLGTTIDDALGEAFDKAAKLLGLPYPGGPAIEEAALRGDGARFALPRPLHGKPGADFSLSGLKTALRLTAEEIAPLSDQDIADLAASFQAAVTDVVANRTSNAMELFLTQPPPLIPAHAGTQYVKPATERSGLENKESSSNRRDPDKLGPRVRGDERIGGMAQPFGQSNRAPEIRNAGKFELPLPGGERAVSLGELQASLEKRGEGARSYPDGAEPPHPDPLPSGARDRAPPTLVVAGGVAANQAIRATLSNVADAHGFRFVAPPARLCSDNGVMIAWAGAERLALGLTDSLDAPARPRWPLDATAEGARA